MVHGFGGTAHHWDRVVELLDGERYSPLALELTDADPRTLDGAIDLIARSAPNRFILCGYSMGGRIALHAAARLPERVTRLVLVSSTAGIEDDVLRAERLSADELLADEIERDGVEAFVSRWRELPLFAGDPAWVEDLVAADERRLSAEALAWTLRAFSPGLLEPLWDRLASLAMAVVVLAGERDERYRAIGERLAAAIPGARSTVVAGAGHRLALEAPEAVVTALGAS
jgi:2-succinyl-6-hydroxy-2,4-cyclohexadiene-1-carboxylate synthase